MNIEQTTEIATLVRQAKKAIIAANDITNSEAKAAMLCGAEHMLQAAVNMLLDARARLEVVEDSRRESLTPVPIHIFDIAGPRA